MTGRSIVTVALGLFMVACGGGGGTGAQPTPSPTVEATTPPPEEECPAQTMIAMNTRTFDPDCVEVARGATLTIENPSDIRHSFTNDKPKVDFDVQDGESADFEVTLKKKEYRFYCKYHSGMFVDVVVT